jgi:integrase
MHEREVGDLMVKQVAERLAAQGKTILDAFEHYMAHLEKRSSPTVSECIAKVLAERESEGCGKRHLSDLRSRLGQFASVFGQRAIGSITSSEVRQWLYALPCASSTKNGFRLRLSLLWNFAVREGWADNNVTKKIRKLRVVASAPGIFTPEHVARMLANAQPQLLPSLCIAAFAGLRYSEVLRLEWKDVNLDSGYIDLSSGVTKTARRRLVAIQPNLRSWLVAAPNKSGMVRVVYDRHYRRLRSRLRDKLGIPWPANGLRHSYASYHLAKFNDAPRLALEMGHSGTNMIFQHYREVVTKDAAERYWSIRP